MNEWTTVPPEHLHSEVNKYTFTIPFNKSDCIPFTRDRDGNCIQYDTLCQSIMNDDRQNPTQKAFEYNNNYGNF
jgi:hypothetical protein